MIPSKALFSVPSFPFLRLPSLLRWGAGLVLAAGGVFGAVWLETSSRARSVFQEGERFRQWARDPSARDRQLQADFLRESRRLSTLQDRRKITEEDLRLELDILRARLDLRRSESPAKRAYFCFREVSRMSMPFEAGYSKQARLLAPAAKQAWREEAAREGDPLPDAAFDPAPGETGGRRAVFSTSDGDEAENLAAILRFAGVAVEVVKAPLPSGAAPLDFWITVPEKDFSRAQGRLAPLLAPGVVPVFSAS